MQWSELFETEYPYAPSSEVVERGASHPAEPNDDYIMATRTGHYFTNLKRNAETIETRLRKYLIGLLFTTLTRTRWIRM